MMRSFFQSRLTQTIVVAGAASSLTYFGSTLTTASTTAQPPAVRRAVCVLNPDGNSGVTGVVTFSQPQGGKTAIKANIRGLTDGKHGFHIHEFGNLTQGCITAGGHYNPFNLTHGGPEDKDRHVGDLGNVMSKDGVAEYSWEDPHIQLSGEYSVIGRSVVVHADEDDLGRGGHADSKTTGHAGARRACGVIGLDKA